MIKIKKMAKFKDLTGSKFGRLYVINQLEKHIYPSGSSRITWNCKWATMKEQCNNRSNNRLIEYNGEIKTLQQWADIIGVHSDKVRHRVNKGKTINEIYKLYNDGKSYFSDNSKDSILFN